MHGGLAPVVADGCSGGDARRPERPAQPERAPLTPALTSQGPSKLLDASWLQFASLVTSFADGLLFSSSTPQTQAEASAGILALSLRCYLQRWFSETVWKSRRCRAAGKPAQMQRYPPVRSRSPVHPADQVQTRSLGGPGTQRLWGVFKWWWRAEECDNRLLLPREGA